MKRALTLTVLIFVVVLASFFAGQSNLGAAQGMAGDPYPYPYPDDDIWEAFFPVAVRVLHLTATPTPLVSPTPTVTPTPSPTPSPTPPPTATPTVNPYP